MVKATKIVTPEGIADWCALDPAAPCTKFDPQWYVDLILEADVADEFIKTASAFYQATRDHFGPDKDANKLPIFKHKDKDGVETGQYKVKCKRVASGIRKSDGVRWEATKPVLFGTDFQPFKLEGTLGKGTKMRASLMMKPYGNPKVGVTFELVSALIIEAEYFGDKATAEDFGGPTSDFATPVTKEAAPVAKAASTGGLNF